jgi:signal transduction histidine kinase
VEPPGTKLVLQNTAKSYTLGPGFPNLRIELTSEPAPSRSPLADFFPAAIIIILVLTIFTGYLLLIGISRDLRVGEMRSQFVASVSHELKTPLTAIRAFTETLVLGRVPDERTRSEYLETVMNESERLARLVDNVLDFSKIEQGKKIYRLSLTSLPACVMSAARAMRYPLEQQGFELQVEIDHDLPEINADADALEQAIMNLLSNAMKYSGASRQIILSCGRRSEYAVIAVTDRGIGIASADQLRVFEKFYRVASPETHLIAGTGLGLTLVKHIAGAHGGSVELKSAPGRGSTFSIRIPCPAIGAGSRTQEVRA